jgi:hypothetical protein
VTAVVSKPGHRGVVESESTEPPMRPGAIEEVVREEPTPRYRMRRDDGQESIHTSLPAPCARPGRAARRTARAAQGDGIRSLDGWVDSSARVGPVIEHPRSVPASASDRKTDGRRFRNTEVLTFDGDQICKQEVYLGWDLE